MRRLMEENQKLRLARAADGFVGAPGIAGQPLEHVAGCQTLAGTCTSLNAAIESMAARSSM